MFSAWCKFTAKYFEENGQRFHLGNKKLVTHSTRKHLVEKLVDNDIMQITGHKNSASINNYSTLSDKKQQQVSGILSGVTAVKTAGNSVKIYSISINETISTSTSYLPGLRPG